MTGVPLEVLASWPTPNYVNPVTRGNAIVVVNGVLMGVSSIVVALRIYTRLKITSSFGADDVLISLGLAFGLAMMIAITVGSASYGWDRHVWDIIPTKLPMSNKLNLVFITTFTMASTLTKNSLFWFCRRLLGTGRKGPLKRYDIVIMSGIVIVSVLGIAFVFVVLFQCRPVSAYWDSAPTYPYKCLDQTAIILSASIVNTLTDLLATLIPMPLIWSLVLPRRQRIAVISIFGLGIFVNVAAICRTFYVHRTMSTPDYDTTWVGWATCIVAPIEIALGLIVASAPALRPLMAFYLPRIFGTTRATDRSGYQVAETYPTKSSFSTNTKDLPAAYTQKSDIMLASLSTPQYSNRAGSFAGIEVTRTVNVETWFKESDTSSEDRRDHSRKNSASTSMQ